VNASSVPTNVYQTSTKQTEVYKTTVKELSKNRAATCSVNGGSNFSCQTDTNGYLYLWLPTKLTTQTVEVTGNGWSCQASGTVAASNDNVFTAGKYVDITTSGLDEGIIGAGYNQKLSATGGTSPYTWSKTGALPDGLPLLTGGIISGIPTEIGKFSFTVLATDSNGLTGTKTMSITVNQTFSIDLSALSVGNGTPSPTFDRNKVVYSVSPNSGDFGDSIAVTATTAYSTATLTINGKTAVSGVASTVSLSNGVNLIPIVVTSPDGLSQKAYILSVTGTGGNTGSGSIPYITIVNSAAFSVTLHNTGGSYAGTVNTAYGKITGTVSGSNTVLTGTLTNVPTTWTEVTLDGSKVMIRSVTAPSTTVQNPSFY